LVSNLMPGGRNGYSLGILMSTAKVPPSYGVSGGPKNWPRRCVRSSPFPAGSTLICESLSFWMSAISLAIRLARLEAMVGAVYGRATMLWRGGEVSMWVNGQAASRVSAGRRSALGSRGSSGRVGHSASQRGNTGMDKRTVPMTAIVQTYRQCWARGVVWRLSRVPGTCRAPWGSWAGGGRVGPGPGRCRVAVFHVVTEGGRRNGR
jgi:hypothetical protein